MDEDRLNSEQEDDEVSETYQSNPTIENYVALRRKYPDRVINIDTLGGFDWLFSFSKDIRSLGIDDKLVFNCICADPEAHHPKFGVVGKDYRAK
jgi:hypothetical protein